jgi:hypothetical protein
MEREARFMSSQKIKQKNSQAKKEAEVVGSNPTRSTFSCVGNTVLF